MRSATRWSPSIAPEEEVQGINDRAQLADAERDHAGPSAAAAMAAGVTLIAPETVFLSYDTRIGRDVVIEPNVVFGPGVTVEDDAVIHAFSHLEGARVASGATSDPSRGCVPARLWDATRKSAISSRSRTAISVPARR